MEEILKVQGLIKMYPKSHRVINGIDLTVNSGEITNIMGEKSSGKSTLLRLICGLEKASDGEIQLCNKNLKAMDGRHHSKFIGKHVGVLSMDFMLLKNMTVIENVSLPLVIQGVKLKEGQNRAKTALEEVGLGNLIHTKPWALKPYEEKSVRLAMGFILEPKLILVDDFFCGITNEEQEKLLVLFKSKLTDNCSVVMLSQKKFTLANRFYTLTDGKLEEAQ